MARTRIYFRFSFFFCVVGIHREKKSRMKDTKVGERERTKSPRSAEERWDERREERRDGRGKTGDAGLEAHTQRERQRKREISEREREREHRRTFYASYVAPAHTSVSRGAHTQFEHTDTKTF